MKISFGTPIKKIPEADIQDLVRALCTPDGCGSERKLACLKTLISFDSGYLMNAINAIDISDINKK